MKKEKSLRHCLSLCAFVDEMSQLTCPAELAARGEQELAALMDIITNISTLFPALGATDGPSDAATESLQKLQGDYRSALGALRSTLQSLPADGVVDACSLHGLQLTTRRDALQSVCDEEISSTCFFFVFGI
jgi:hypothetical protein